MRICPSCRRKVDGELTYCPHCGTALPEALVREQRKTISIVFCDVTGSTSLGESIDPETLRRLLARYFERMRAIVERHGGTVEKYIGDAVMAVFGIPHVHEDDALRAIRAAAEMREALPELGVQARIGVNTGEVVAGTEERLATGDAVNVAARLEQAAQPGEVLIGALTLALAQAAVDVQAVEPLALKGKADPVPAYRLLHVLDVAERRPQTSFVGRGHELALLRDAWQRVLARRRCEQVTVVGDAGMGKSRLVAEALASIEAMAFRGRCLPYGEGITYWPVVEVLKQLDRLPPDESAATIRSLLGNSRAATSPDEIAWAFRKTLELAAAEQPIVVVFDDIQWGEETFLDLIEHVALLSSGPILLLCMARPEFTDRRPSWPVAIRLEPLPDDDVQRLLPERLGSALREKIARAAGGNPLFVEEMVAIAGEADGDVVIPPTLQALLAARLDQLDTAERSVLERGAVEGEIFHRGAVKALSLGETQVIPRLVALVRKGFIMPDKAQLPGEDAFRFRHLLIRDAAYDALWKATRAELHRRFASWLEERGGTLVELDEILGYHFEQAVRYTQELGQPADEALAAGARRRLAAAGQRANLRQDYGAAAGLLERAVRLTPAAQVDVVLELDLIDALFWGGKGGEALRRAGAIAERAAVAGDRVGELCWRIKEGTLRTAFEPEGAAERLARLVEQALPVFEAAGDDVALCVAYEALGQAANIRAQMDTMAEAYEHAAAHAARTSLRIGFVGRRNYGLSAGTTPVSALLDWQDELDEADRRNPGLRGWRAWALALLGRIEESRALLAEVREEMVERGATALGSMVGVVGVRIELLAGDPAAAVALGEEGCRLLNEMGQLAVLSTAAGNLAQAYYELGQLEEADAWAGRADELGSSDDAATQMLWRQARAKVLARRGDYAQAESLAREAVTIGETTEALNDQADTYADLAEVLSLAGRHPEAAAALEEALTRYEQKGNIVMLTRTRGRLAAVRSEAQRNATELKPKLPFGPGGLERQ
jgi:class 3 adenylate cyclase/tetratricopeptide (TPR) repeat protein